jgi:hypothetical protein
VIEKDLIRLLASHQIRVRLNARFAQPNLNNKGGSENLCNSNKKFLIECLDGLARFFIIPCFSTFRIQEAIERPASAARCSFER